MTPPDPAPPAHGVRAALVRGAAFLGLWLVLTGAAPDMLLPGLAAALLATWVSLRLAGPSGLRPSPVALTRLALDLSWQVLVAGSDVAWRALHPRLPIRPGVVTVPLRLPPGGARDGFTSLVSLAPGTLPIGADAEGHLALHCLDVGSDVVAQVVGQERKWARVLGVTLDDG